MENVESMEKPKIDPAEQELLIATNGVQVALMLDSGQPPLDWIRLYTTRFRELIIEDTNFRRMVLEYPNASEDDRARILTEARAKLYMTKKEIQ